VTLHQHGTTMNFPLPNLTPPTADAWHEVFKLVTSGKIPASDVAVLASTLIADLKQIGSGIDLTPTQVKLLASTALPVVGQIAGILFPALKPELAAMKLILKLSHPMTPVEEQHWMDRASGGPSGGLR
jgi:hypothetical protein